MLRLWLASESRNPLKVAKVVDDVSSVARLNTRVSHLQREKVFGSTKHKLHLSPRDESDSHRHDRINHSLPKLSKKASPSQCQSALSKPSIAQCGRLPLATTSLVGIVRLKNGLLILKSQCTDLLSWRIERISPSSLDLCRGHSTNETKCNAKIAKYRRVVAGPTFIGIHRLRKSRETE